MMGSCKEFCILEIEFDFCRCMIDVEVIKEDLEVVFGLFGEYFKDFDFFGFFICIFGVDVCFCVISLYCVREFSEQK